MGPGHLGDHPQLRELSSQSLAPAPSAHWCSGLGLPDRRLTLHIHPFVGSGNGRFGSYQRIMEPITATPAEIIYQPRVPFA
jgi:hypothetical protein